MKKAAWIYTREYKDPVDTLEGFDSVEWRDGYVVFIFSLDCQTCIPIGPHISRIEVGTKTS